MYKTFLRNLFGNRFVNDPLIEVIISRERILNNLRAFQNGHPTMGIAPVLKSNAYGHGIKEVGEILNNASIPFLCVDSYYEARVLRGENINTPILVLGYTPLNLITRNTFKDITFSLLSIEEIKRVAETLATPTLFHLEIDTGMHRRGVLPEDLPRALSLLKTNSFISLDGAFSHFADADIPNSSLTPIQISRWKESLSLVRKQFPRIRYIHFAATKGSVYIKELGTNVMRLGIGLYGIAQGQIESANLLPALEMRTRIDSLRTVEAGESVGYNATYTALKRTRIVSIPVGYYEGIDRRLSNKGVVLVRNIPCPILGRVSMNITSVDISNVPEVKLDEEVVVMSANPSAPNSIEKIAAQCGTIPYDILVHIPAHLRRTVV